MGCHKCAKDSKYHSFEFISRRPSGEAVFYTCPAKGRVFDMKEEDIPDYLAHMDEASMSSWIWVFDCSGLQALNMPSINVVEVFIKVIQERYKFVLKHIYIVNINWKMNILLNMAKYFIKDDMGKKLMILKTPLELLSNHIDPKLIALK
jgi:hypothetical protein